MIDSNTFKKIEEQFQKGLPLVFYALPERLELTLLLQKEQVDYDPCLYSENAFHFSPFDEKKRGYCIPFNSASTLIQKLSLTQQKSENIEILSEKVAIKEYAHLFSKAINFIYHKKAEKVVISRMVSIPIKKMQFEVLFQRLFALYPKAFRYVWFHPDTGLWCGATPELLLHGSDGYFNTMALAGTKIGGIGDKVIWDEKERIEHQIVVDDILDKLQTILSVIKVSKTYTYTAGPLLHLRTDISGQLKKGKTSLLNVAANLHPTPAVCGVPRGLSKKFIKEQENYDRQFYTGYLGPVHGAHEESHLFVNLRCMKIEGNIAQIYVGGGITKDSQVNDEWKETENKMQTMLQVLQPFV